MRFRIDQRYAHAVEAVEAALVSAEFLEAMGELPKLGRPQLLARSEDGDTVRLRVRYAFVGDVSPAVRAVVDPARLTWVQESIVNRATHRTRFTILPDHYASLLRAAATSSLADDGRGGTRRTIEGDVRVSVPLVGGKVEKAIISGLQEHAVEEARLLEEWAARSA